MRKSMLFSCLILSIVFLFSTASYAQTGSISGTVSDEWESQPIGNLFIQVFTGPCSQNFVTGANTNASGEYTVSGLAPGEYLVRACPDCNGQEYISTWYGNEPWMEDCNKAVPVTVVADETTPNIDFVLREGPRVLNYLDLGVYNGKLQPGFQLMPWAADFLEGAVISFPNAARSDYTFNLAADKINWDAECRQLFDFWTHDFGAVAEPADYGTYTLTLTFKGGMTETFSGTLESGTVVGAADDANLTAVPQENGDLIVTWAADGTPEAGQTWQVRVREGGIIGDPGREVFRSGTTVASATSMTIPAGNLGCVALGGAYRVRVRAYSENNARSETVEKAFTYNPSSLVDRYSYVDVQSQGTGGNLGIGFDVRPASRADIVSASVLSPSGVTFYNFDLTNDWYDISTKTRINKGWWVVDPDFPVENGTYTFAIEYSDGYWDIVTKPFTDASVTGVDPGSMQAQVGFGGVQFMWTLPAASNQQYQVRVRSQDGSREYFKSGSFTDVNQIWASSWDLRALVPGRVYMWQLRVFDPNYGVREQAGGTFYYDPYRIAGPGPNALWFFDVAVYDGEVQANFGVTAGFRDSLVGAYLKLPNDGRTEYPEYAYNLVDDRVTWDSECRFLDLWQHTFGAVAPADYGTYTLVLAFEVGDPVDPEIVLQSYDFTLREATVTAARDLSVTVNDDGSVQVNWSPDGTLVSGQQFQVRVRDAATNKELYKSQNLDENTTSFTIPAADLGCVPVGVNHKWLVRAYDSTSQRAETRFVEEVYSPGALAAGTLIPNLYVADHNGKLGVQFNVRPSDRENVLWANITGPAGSGVNYDYNITTDWSDSSTESRWSSGWFHLFTADDLVNDGVYTLTVRIDRNGNDAWDEGTDTEAAVSHTLTLTSMSAVDQTTMQRTTNWDGGMGLSWDLPVGVTGQRYQVRVRSLDGSLEYVSKTAGVDSNGIYLSSWDLRAMEHGEQYIWFVRAWDDDSDSMAQSQSLTFFYDPYYLYSEPVPPVPTGISGTVTESGVTPIAGLHVYAQSEACGGDWLDGTSTDSNGYYVLDDLPPGDVYVRACASCNGNPYVDEWYDGVYNGCSDASPVTVTQDQVTGGVDFQLETGGTISGVVYEEDGTTPIPDVHLYASDAVTNEWTAGVNTVAGGTYTLRVPPGTYVVYACPTCPDPPLPYIGEYYDEAATWDTATEVSVEGSEDIPNVDFTLTGVVVRPTTEQAVLAGLTWLADQQKTGVTKSWAETGEFELAKTALAVLCLESGASPYWDLEPMDSNYPYYTHIRGGLDFLFANAYVVNIGLQSNGNPDTDGDTLGVYFDDSGATDHQYVRNYNTSIAIMALAASGVTDPANERVVDLPGSPIHGWTYRQVLQDAVDWLAWAQTDIGSGQGGWNYTETTDEFDSGSDQSNSGWSSLALAYAEAYGADVGLGVTIPGFVRSQLGVWINTIQVIGGDQDGGADYNPSSWSTDDMPNMLLTGNLLQQMALVGDTASADRVQAAVGYLDRQWAGGWQQNPVSHHTTYTVMKGLDALDIQTVGTHDWFAEFDSAIRSEQTGPGYWPSSQWDTGDHILSTEWALLTLLRAVAPTEENPDILLTQVNKTWVDEGAGTYQVSYEVKNGGNVQAPAGHDVALYIDGVLKETKEITEALDPGATAAGSFAAITLSGVTDEVKVIVDANQEVGELNEDNNTYLEDWPPPVSGDFNGDGDVTLADAILVLQVLAGLDPGEVNMAGDVDGDNRLGPADALYILQKLEALR